MEEKFELYFNNQQPSGMDISSLTTRHIPHGIGWYRIGTYPYDIALDLGHLYLQIPFPIRKTLGEIQIREMFNSAEQRLY